MHLFWLVWVVVGGVVVYGSGGPALAYVGLAIVTLLVTSALRRDLHAVRNQT